jgi:alginate O-acetyltransferase complex protein AlgI
MADQLSSHEVIPSVMGGAIARFIVGLTQKMLLANTFGLLADQIFGLSSLDLSFASAWIGLVAYTLQIYFDFAGYSNMAIGIGSLFGFKLTENFNLPYTALSIGEFWEKWHMSLTGWLRQYIYFPLGGNRKGVLRTYLNIAVVFLVSGIWHGVGWNFVLWGLWHGLFMIIEKWRGWTKPGHIYTMFVVMIGWVFFRSPGLTSAINYLYALVPTGESMVSKIYWLNYLTPYTTAVFVLGILLAGGFRVKLPAKLAFLKPLSLAILFLISLLSVAGSTYNSFIYFKF